MKKLVLALALTMFALPALYITSTSVNAAEKHRNTFVNVSVLQIYYDEYTGKYVSVNGFMLAVSDDFNVLYEEGESLSSLFLNLNSLDKTLHKRALQQCDNGCNVTVGGVVEKVMMNKGIKVTAITF